VDWGQEAARRSSPLSWKGAVALNVLKHRLSLDCKCRERQAPQNVVDDDGIRIDACSSLAKEKHNEEAKISERCRSDEVQTSQDGGRRGCHLVFVALSSPS
jgi:hypothetical protein